jgi:hypothetical protein
VKRAFKPGDRVFISFLGVPITSDGELALGTVVGQSTTGPWVSVRRDGWPTEAVSFRECVVHHYNPIDALRMLA